MVAGRSLSVSRRSQRSTSRVNEETEGTKPRELSRDARVQAGSSNFTAYLQILEQFSRENGSFGRETLWYHNPLRSLTSPSLQEFLNLNLTTLPLTHTPVSKEDLAVLDLRMLAVLWSIRGKRSEWVIWKRKKNRETIGRMKRNFLSSAAEVEKVKKYT